MSEEKIYAKSNTYSSPIALETISATQFMLLSMLVQKPRTGYELGRLSQAPANLIWAVKLSQLYPELAKLAALGLVDFERSAGRGPLDKKTYSVTAPGRKALADFLLGPMPEETQRNMLAVSALACLVLTQAEAAAYWRREANRLRADVIAVRERWEHNRQLYDRAAAPEPPNPAFGPWAALELAARQRDAEAGLAAELAERLAAGAGDEAAALLPEDAGKSRLTPLQRALLAVLAIRPRTGYDFALLSKPPANLLWSVSLSQIYPALTKLAASGLASYATSAGRGPLDKKTYTITDAGRAALRHELLLPSIPEANRCLLSIWAHGTWILEPGVAARVWLDRAAALEADCAAIAHRRGEVYAVYGTANAMQPHEPGFATWALFEMAIRRRRAEAGFARELAARYQAAAASQTVPPGRERTATG